MAEKKTITGWPRRTARGSKRTHIIPSEWLDDWFVGHGKDESCVFEGSWWDMVCFARNVLASENTKLACPEFYKPEWLNMNYTGEDKPYEFVKEATDG